MSQFGKPKTTNTVQGNIHSSYGYTPSSEAFRLNLKADMLEYCARSGVVTVVNIKNMVFWGTTSCTLVDRYYQSRLHRIPEHCNITKILSYGITCLAPESQQFSAVNNLCKHSPRLTIQQMENTEGKNRYDGHVPQLAL
jgi:hypothetical protein